MDATVKTLGSIYGFAGGNFAGLVYDTGGVSPTLKTMQGGNRQPLIIERTDENNDRPRAYQQH